MNILVIINDGRGWNNAMETFVVNTDDWEECDIINRLKTDDQLFPMGEEHGILESLNDGSITLPCMIHKTCEVITDK